jgi:hypothetical protein
VGQYFAIFNLDKKECLTPTWFGQFHKLPGLARPGDGLMTGLAILLAKSGSGYYREGPIYGRWAGDRIAIVGDYFDGEIAGCMFTEDNWVEKQEQVERHVRAV